MELLELKGSGASKLLSNLVKADIIEPVSGHEKENINSRSSLDIVEFPLIEWKFCLI